MCTSAGKLDSLDYGDTLSGLQKGDKMYKVINNWIEYIHPKLGCIEIAKIEDEKEIKEKGHIIIKKVINGELVPIEA